MLQQEAINVLAPVFSTIGYRLDAIVWNREYALKRLCNVDELTAEWTLEPNAQSQLANKTGATRLGFAA